MIRIPLFAASIQTRLDATRDPEKGLDTKAGKVWFCGTSQSKTDLVETKSGEKKVEDTITKTTVGNFAGTVTIQELDFRAA